MRICGVIPSICVLRMRRAAMMGRQDEPERLFYEFRLESHVPRDHLLRGIDAVFDFTGTRKSSNPIIPRLDAPRLILN
jgi:hypothetical protein